MERKMTTIEILINIISDVLGEKVELTNDTDLVSDLALNSLDIVEIIVQAEDAFNTTIDDRTIRRIKTVADIIRLVE